MFVYVGLFMLPVSDDAKRNFYFLALIYKRIRQWIHKIFAVIVLKRV